MFLRLVTFWLERWIFTIFYCHQPSLLGCVLCNRQVPMKLLVCWLIYKDFFLEILIILFWCIYPFSVSVFFILTESWFSLILKIQRILLYMQEAWTVYNRHHLTILTTYDNLTTLKNLTVRLALYTQYLIYTLLYI